MSFKVRKRTEGPYTYYAIDAYISGKRYRQNLKAKKQVEAPARRPLPYARYEQFVAEHRRERDIKPGQRDITVKELMERFRQRSGIADETRRYESESGGRRFDSVLRHHHPPPK